MSNLKDYDRGRNDGLAMALRIVESDGIEGLRREIKFRGVTGIHTTLAKKELDQASKQIKEMTLDTMIVLAVATLHDEFDFGQKRCQRFMDRLELKAGCLIDDLATWPDYIKAIKDEIGLELSIRENL
ncbi:MAG: hypothetical protein SO181_10055 [Frisingicoccus sp.]|uniref:hypothetical protein n=1 Tax=Frisingicoccus sp. TaxID=1918627 RepID=UPI002A7EA698|nr:hypothetical protein [Frisingicoccus sp.]MDY4835469.1 hypothetical protein [Frisingicoccus sp.]